MKNGRQKQNNITLIGTTNCGNSFLLDPLELIYKYKTFMNPSATFYAWVGLEECKIAYLIDFRYTLEWIKWSDFLLLLEDRLWTFLVLKINFQVNSQFCEIIQIIPFFATSKSPIEYIGKDDVRDDLETEMMSSKWKVFSFKNQISPKKNKRLP